MSTTAVNPVNQTFRTIRLVFGVLAVLLGIAVLVWPGATLLVVAVLIGIELIVAGIARIVLARRQTGGSSTLSVVLGVLVLLAGIICLFRPGASLFALAVIIAVGWLLDGISEIMAGTRGGRSGGERVALILFGVLSILAAIIVLVAPGASLVLLVQVTGIVLVVLGVMSVVGALLGRRSHT